MPIEKEDLLTLWPILEEIQACDEGTKLAKRFLEAAGECVSTLGKGRTSSSRGDLLWTYNAMVLHGDKRQVRQVQRELAGVRLETLYLIRSKPQAS